MESTTDKLLLPLPGFFLPRDFAWHVRFIAAVDEQLRRLRSTGHFQPPRFFGYFFQGDHPVGVTGSWVVTLDCLPLLLSLPPAIASLTGERNSICSESVAELPDYILVHDTLDGSCWLWRFSDGLRFVESAEPVNESSLA
jgi:hypothetical protein